MTERVAGAVSTGANRVFCRTFGVWRGRDTSQQRYRGGCGSRRDLADILIGADFDGPALFAASEVEVSRTTVAATIAARMFFLPFYSTAANPDARSRNRRYSAHGFSARNRERSIALAKHAR
jgi:hypothetical protein